MSFWTKGLIAPGVKECSPPKTKGNLFLFNTNLLILDEIFDSSLDASGTDEFMRILSNKLAKENVFVISHKGDTLLDKFPSVLKFEKYKNFTRMA